MSDRKFPVPLPHGPPQTYGSTEAVLVHAAQHARNRLLHACEAISMVAGLARKSRRRTTPVFSLAGAKIQDATAGVGEQAAHVLVGQLLIDGNPPWALAGGETMKLAWLARFMVTAAVPVPFNSADSAAESGLKEAFRRACERAWIHVVQGGQDLVNIYEMFLDDADRAFQNAEHAKKLKQKATSSKGDARKSDERMIEGLILRVYRLHNVTAKEANRLFPL